MPREKGQLPAKVPLGVTGLTQSIATLSPSFCHQTHCLTMSSFCPKVWPKKAYQPGKQSYQKFRASMRREEILIGDSIRDSSCVRFSVSSTNMRVRLRNCGVLLDTRVPLSIQVTVLNESQILDSVLDYHHLSPQCCLIILIISFGKAASLMSVYTRGRHIQAVHNRISLTTSTNFRTLIHTLSTSWTRTHSNSFPKLLPPS